MLHEQPAARAERGRAERGRRGHRLTAVLGLPLSVVDALLAPNHGRISGTTTVSTTATALTRIRLFNAREWGEFWCEPATYARKAERAGQDVYPLIKILSGSPKVKTSMC
jgi:hypothetical protein